MNAILDCETEPSEEVWQQLENRKTAEEISELLGFTNRYLTRLAADALALRMANGDSYAALADILGPLGVHCWGVLLTRCNYRSSSARRQVALMHGIGMGVSEISRYVGARVQTTRALLAVSLLTDGERGDIERKWGFRPNERSVSACPLNVNSDIRKWVIKAHVAGWTPAQLSELLGVSEVDARNHLIVALVESGQRLNDVAQQFGLSRERVRQLATKVGVTSRGARRTAKLVAENESSIARARIREWVRTHPGCTVDEVASALELKPSDRPIPSDVSHLVLGKRSKSGSVVTKYSRAATLNALRQAFEIRNPLSSMYREESRLPVSGPYYENLRRSGQVDGPSEVRIIQVFGSWSAACQLAGVPSLPPRRAEYSRRWTDEELVEHLAAFLLQATSSHIETFDMWSRQDEARPSSGTIQNQMRVSWSDAKKEALRSLRSRWTTS